MAGTIVVAFLAIYLAHGVSIGSTVALAGTIVSLVVTAQALDLRGLLVAGIVVGALGVLDDVTVSQVSTVAALRRANPNLSKAHLYREATKVGRDHVASTVNTLILAYAGASLPLLLFFAEGTQPVGRLITGEVVAVEIVRMLVGSVGLVLSVPITTALAAAVLSPDDTATHAGHDHGHVPVPAGVAAHREPSPLSWRERRARDRDPWSDWDPDRDF